MSPSKIRERLGQEALHLDAKPPIDLGYGRIYVDDPDSAPEWFADGTREFIRYWHSIRVIASEDGTFPLEREDLTPEVVVHTVHPDQPTLRNIKQGEVVHFDHREEEVPLLAA